MTLYFTASKLHSSQSGLMIIVIVHPGPLQMQFWNMPCKVKHISNKGASLHYQSQSFARRFVVR